MEIEKWGKRHKKITGKTGKRGNERYMMETEIQEEKRNGRKKKELKEKKRKENEEKNSSDGKFETKHRKQKMIPRKIMKK